MKALRVSWVIGALLAALVAAITVLFRVPIPKSGGYLNMGDVVIIFAALQFGRTTGFLVGGVGSAIADLIGYPVFAPITLLVKGAEGFIAGLRIPGGKFLSATLGVLVMVAGYFGAEVILFPQEIGLAAAITELPFNMLQGIIGLLGGYILHRSISTWMKAEDSGSTERPE